MLHEYRLVYELVDDNGNRAFYTCKILEHNKQHAIERLFNYLMNKTKIETSSAFVHSVAMTKFFGNKVLQKRLKGVYDETRASTD